MGAKMRKLQCLQAPGLTVEEVLEELNERAQEFGVSEADIVSVSAWRPTGTIKVHTDKGPTDARVEVVIFYWKGE
jgi:hypothetical protein